MVFITALGVILLAIILFAKYQRKMALAKLKNQLIENWGSLKLEKYQPFNLIEKYFRNNIHQKKAYQIISDRVASDLDLDDVFSYIDRTSSRIGQQFLYYKLRTINDKASLAKLDSLSQLFTNPVLRMDCQMELSKLSDREGYDLESLINDEHPPKPQNMWLAYVASFAAITIVIIAIFKPIFILGLIPILILNWLTHYKNKLNIDLYVNGVVQLKKSLKVARTLASFPEIKTFYTEFIFFEKIKSFDRKIKFIGFEKDLGNEISGVGWTLTELIKIFFNLEYIVFYSFIESVSIERESIDKLFCFIGEVDSAISVASLKASGDPICTPEFSSNNLFSAEKMVHPLIESCVVNSVELKGKSMLLTGSNMSGKTTFIRTVAINALLAQTLNICFANRFVSPFFKIYTSIRITDDLLDDTSYYLEEVNTIKKLIEASEGSLPCLFILDEIFKGTNTIERISGGKAILSYLNKPIHTVFVSTHDIELTELLQDDNYDLYHFTEQVTNFDLDFDHKLKKGPLKTRNAIKILELHDYPNEIIEEARRVKARNFTISSSDIKALDK